MKTVVFDGRSNAREVEAKLRERVSTMKKTPRIATVVFEEDEAGQIYTRLKKQAAVRVGVEFSESVTSVGAELNHIAHLVKVYGEQDDIDGIMVQKPTQETWGKYGSGRVGFGDWWQMVVSNIPSGKDVDCLRADSLAKIVNGDYDLLPATVEAVMEIVRVAMPEKLDGQTKTGLSLLGIKAVVLGRSDIVGAPVARVLAQSGAEVENYGRDVDWSRVGEADLLVSATGIPELVGGDRVKEGSVVIDVGSPKGDVVFDEMVGKARFVTPVPGGVGPMTVVSLLSNLVMLGMGN